VPPEKLVDDRAPDALMSALLEYEHGRKLVQLGDPLDRSSLAPLARRAPLVRGRREGAVPGWAECYIVTDSAQSWAR